MSSSRSSCEHNSSVSGGCSIDHNVYIRYGKPKSRCEIPQSETRSERNNFPSTYNAMLNQTRWFGPVCSEDEQKDRARPLTIALLEKRSLHSKVRHRSENELRPASCRVPSSHYLCFNVQEVLTLNPQCRIKVVSALAKQKANHRYGS